MPESYQLQYDEQGRPYFQLPGQKRNYVSPVAMGGAPPVDETGIFRSRPQWNNQTGQWETPIDWSNIATLATGSALGAGAASAFGLFGAGAGATGAGSTAAGTTAAGTTAAGTTAAGTTAAGTTAVAAGVKGATAAAAGLGARDWLNLAIFGGQTAAGIWGAKSAAGATDRAAEAQLQASREALAFLKEQWQQDRADFAPYLEMGRGAIGRITDGINRPPPNPLPESIARGALGPRTAAPTSTTTRDFGTGQVKIPGGGGGTPSGTPTYGVGRRGPNGEYLDFGMSSPAVPGGGVAGPASSGGGWGTVIGRDPSSGLMLPPGGSGPVLAPAGPDAYTRAQPGARGYGQVAAPPPAAAPLVRMQAPTGEIQAVPQDQVGWLQARGAKLVT